MKYRLLIFIIFISFIRSHSQSLSVERVKKIKNSTVKIIAGTSTGTGFFIDEKGTVVTCWHVVSSSIDSLKSVYISINDKLVEFWPIANYDFRKGNKFDYCILSPKHPLPFKTIFYKIGDFEKTNEGQEIYTCGYPLGDLHPFISKGIISTKYTDSNNKIRQALLDLTLNVGNSGGAIVKVGKTINEDEIIGIANFGFNPINNIYNINTPLLTEKINNSPHFGFVKTDKNGNINNSQPPLDMNSLINLLIDCIQKLSIGVSGCISINYLKQCFITLK